LPRKIREREFTKPQNLHEYKIQEQ